MLAAQHIFYLGVYQGSNNNGWWTDYALTNFKERATFTAKLYSGIEIKELRVI